MILSLKQKKNSLILSQPFIGRKYQYVYMIDGKCVACIWGDYFEMPSENQVDIYIDECAVYTATLLINTPVEYDNCEDGK